MSDYKVAIANCVIPGEEFTVQGNRRVRNFIRINLDSFDIEICQRDDFYESVAHKYKGLTKYTTDLVIRELPRGKISSAKNLVSDIVELLSFITCSEVRAFEETYYTTHFTNCSEVILTSWPIIKRFRGKYVKEYLESVWPEYRRLREVRKFNVVLHYFTSIHKENQPLEIKLVLLFVLFENLKHTYAQEEGYPFINGHFRAHGATIVRKGRGKTFKELLTSMFSEVGMTPDFTALISLRNEIIHSGISVLDVSTRYEIYKSCQKLFREYFLRLLKFRGEYKLCDEQTYLVM
jgi:hypothetical protein